MKPVSIRALLLAIAMPLVGVALIKWVTTPLGIPGLNIVVGVIILVSTTVVLARAEKQSTPTEKNDSNAQPK